MRSVFLWRMLVILLITVLAASLLMTGGYIYMSRDTYTAFKLAELAPEADAIGQIYVEHATGLLERDTFFRLIDKLMQAADATCIITDSQGQPVYQSVDFGSFASEAYEDVIRAEITGALSGARFTDGNIRLKGRGAALSVCVPIPDAGGEIAGSVYLLQSPAEVERAMERLNRSLVLITVLVVPGMLLFSTFGVRRVMEPLRKMSAVALEMSKGDFVVRANEEEIGEVGLLARALNQLCDTLSKTIHQLRAEKSQLRQILASLSEGVAATDSVGCLTIYNPALMHMFGAVRVGTRQELIPDADVWNAFDEVYATGKPAEIHYKTAGERMLWISLTPILADDGAHTGVVGLFRDMTELENLENARTDYIQNINHELRTPLTAIRGLLEPLADGMVQSEDDRQRYYRIMLREVERLGRLIRDMMELSRLQSGMEYMDALKADINEILEDVCVNYGNEAKQRGITLVLNAPKLPFVLTDPDRVEQLLVILLSNAMRYTPPGGTITLGGEDGPRVSISVADTGCGILEKDLPHIFERFYTADKSRREGNTGLGLSIAKQIIDKLGERIAVENRPGEGAVFRFTLKKYVSNAIALGPARDEWQDVEGEPVRLFTGDDTPPPVDAPYVQVGEDAAQPKGKKTKTHDRKKPR